MFYKVDELAHYGIKGQKWGLRRFQNEDGTYTEAGKQRYGNTGEKISYKEAKTDNRVAFELGRISTISDAARDISYKKTDKLQKKLDAAVATDKQKKAAKLQKKLSTEISTGARLEEMADIAKTAMNDHRDYLIKKYGKEKISDIKEKEVTTPVNGTHKNTNERTVSNAAIAQSILTTFGTLSLSIAAGFPLYLVSVPIGKTGQAAGLRSLTRAAVKSENKEKERSKSNGN